MKQLITTLLLCLITMGAQAKTDLVPTPQSVIWGDGNYTAFVRDNMGGAYPRLGYDKSVNNFVASDFWLRDGSYFKIQTVELAYSFVPRRSKVVKGVKLSLRGANLLTLTGVEYIDPESTVAGVSEYPLFRTVAAGAKFNF